MEAVTQLAWFLLQSLEEEKLVQHLLQNRSRKNLIRLIKLGIPQQKRQMKSFMQTYLEVISPILLHGTDEAVAEFHFDLVISLLLIGIARNRVRLNKLITKKEPMTGSKQIRKG